MFSSPARRRSPGLVVLQPRSRRETVFLVSTVCIAAFFLVRITSLYSSQTTTASARVTQVLHRLADDDRDGGTLVTELVLDTRKRQAYEKQKQVKLGLAQGNSEGAVAGGKGELNPQQQGQGSSGTSRDNSKELKDQADSSAKAGGEGGVSQDSNLQQGQQVGAAGLVSDSSAAQKDRLPTEFDWQTYLLYHPDLRDRAITTESQAKEHYLKEGRAEGRIYKRLRVLLRYTACTGLINQHYSHIAAFSLAAVLGAEIVLPPAAKRDSFAHYFSVFKEHNEVTWTPAPLESLLNVDKVIDVWTSKGLIVHKTPSLTPFPDLTAPETAYPMYAMPNIDPLLVTRISGVYLQNLDMPELIEKARRAVMEHTASLLKKNPDYDISYVVLDLPCTFFMLRSLSNLRVVTEVAKSLEFAPFIQSLADRIISAVTQGGKREFNAVHLRVEKDAKDWSQIMGGPEVVWHAYTQSMRQAGFTADLPMYAASGLLTYGASDDMDHIINTMKQFGLCNEVLYKELYIKQSEVDALNSEQKALLDLLVLSRGKSFVGFGSSTFSFYLREYRVLNGMPRSSSVLVDASVIGTDPLFNSAGTII